MSYRRRGYRRQSNSIGSTVGDVAYIANRFGPKGAFIAGLTGFIFFYFLIPIGLEHWVEYNKAKMTGQNATVMRQLLDSIFSRRFIRPCELAGMAMLVLGAAIALWKIWNEDRLSRVNEREAGFWARLVARLFD